MHILALIVFIVIHGLIGLFRYLFNFIFSFLFFCCFEMALWKALVEGGHGFIKEKETNLFSFDVMRNLD